MDRQDIIERLQFIADNTHDVIPEEIEEVCDAAVKLLSPARGDGPLGWKLAMSVLQSDLYRKLDDEERAECDALVAKNPYTTPTPPSAEGEPVGWIQELGDGRVFFQHGTSGGAKNGKMRKNRMMITKSIRRQFA